MGKLDALWMPYTGNREFKRAPRLVARAEGVHYFTPEGRPILDGISGLWCVSAGHARTMLNLIADEGLVARVQALAPYFEDRVHALKGEPGVVSIRNIGLAAAVELAPEPGHPGRRGHRALRRCFELGLLTRAPGDALLLAPPFISERSDIDRAVEVLARAIRDVAGDAEGFN